MILQSDHALYADKVGVSDVVALAQARDLAEMNGDLAEMKGDFAEMKGDLAEMHT